MVKISRPTAKASRYFLHKVPICPELKMNFYRIIFVLYLLISLHGIMGHDSIVEHKNFQNICTSRGGVSFNQEGEKVNSFKEKEFLEQQKLRQGHG